jgi:hypothetical protein
MVPEHMMTLADFFEKTHWVDFREDWDDPVSVRKLAAAVRRTVAFPEGKPELSPLRIRFDAFRWEAGSRKDSSLLYRGSDLREAQLTIQRRSGQLPPEAIAFVSKSAAVARTRFWVLRGITVAVIVTITILLITTEKRRRGEQQARRDAETALQRETAALAKEQSALKSEKQAVQDKEKARKGEAEAKGVAEQQRDIAVQQRNVAYSRFLIAEGEKLLQRGQDQRASGYFVAALELTDSPEARGSLFSQMLKNPHLAMAGIGVPGTISAIATTSNGHVATADREGTVAITALGASGALSSTYGGTRQVASFKTTQSDRIAALEYADDEHSLLGLGVSGTLYEWLLEDEQMKLASSTKLKDVREAVEIEEAVPGPPPYALSQHTVAVGSEGEGAIVFRMSAIPRPPDEIAKFSDRECFGLALALDAKGRWLACYAQTGGAGLWINIWDLSDSHLARAIKLPGGFAFPSSIAISPNGKFVAIGERGDIVAIWNWQDKEAAPIIPPPHEVSQLGGRGARPVSYLAFSPDGELLTTIYGGRAYLWNVTQGVQMAALPNGAGASAVTDVVLARDQKSWLVGRSRGISVVDLNPTVWEYWACIDAGGRGLEKDEWSRLLPGLPYRCTCTYSGPCRPSVARFLPALSLFGRSLAGRRKAGMRGRSRLSRSPAKARHQANELPLLRMPSRGGRGSIGL